MTDSKKGDDLNKGVELRIILKKTAKLNHKTSVSDRQYIIVYYTSWQPVLRYGESVFTKESQGTEFFVVVALLCKFSPISKLYIDFCPRRRLLRRMCTFKKGKNSRRMRGIPSNIHQVIKTNGL